MIFESWPAELTVTMKPADGVFELLMVYEVTMLGGPQTMSRDDKKKWKAAVEEDAYQLAARLQDLSEHR